MKITSFCPMIISTNAEETVEAYKSIGFEVRHTKEKAGIEGQDNTSTILKNENGDRIIVTSSSNIPKSFTMVHINVDNFDEAVEHFEKLGYKMVGKAGSDNTSAIATAMVAPDGHMIQISEHLK